MFLRRLPPFAYHAPASIAEAISLLTKYGKDAKVFAGGTDLFPAMKRRAQAPAHLINLKGIGELKGISLKGKGDESICIGALSTLGELERSALVRQHLPALREAVEVMASPQIRTLATIGGNICSALPSADTVPPLIALQASLRLAGRQGDRQIPVENFFKGPGESVLWDDEILLEILLPKPPERSGATYRKLMRRQAMELALVGVAVYLRFAASGKACREARIALGAVAPTPIRAPEAEAMLVGRQIDETAALEAARAAAAICCPRSDSIRASVAYRRSMVEVMTKRAILGALESIGPRDPSPMPAAGASKR